MLLTAYLIGSDPVGTVVSDWNGSQLNGNPAFLVESVVSTGRGDISNMGNWNKWGSATGSDHLKVRSEIQKLLDSKTWALASSSERDIAIDFWIKEDIVTISDDNTNKVTHLMTTQGMTQADAVSLLQSKFGENHIKNIEACNNRGAHSKLYRLIAKYLSFQDAHDFNNTVRDLLSDYKTQALLGTEDSTGMVGLFDYIENTAGTIYATAGLASKAYVMQNGDLDMTNFTIELMSLFRDGDFS